MNFVCELTAEKYYCFTILNIIVPKLLSQTYTLRVTIRLTVYCHIIQINRKIDYRLNHTISYTISFFDRGSLRLHFAISTTFSVNSQCQLNQTIAING
jgi:hypothetical protein